MLPFDPAELSYAPLSDDCPREAFSCGEDVVDLWFKEKACLHHSRHNCRVTVIFAPDDDIPVAFYAYAVVVDRLFDKATLLETILGQRDYFPSLRLEWIAVRIDLQKKGLGSILMGRVLADFEAYVAHAGLPALTLKALNEQAQRFYKKLNFIRYGPDVHGRRMVLPARMVIAAEAVASEIPA